MELSHAVMLLCLIDATVGVPAQNSFPSQCSVTSTLLDVLKNNVKDLRQNDKKLEDKYDDRLKRLEDRYDDMLDIFKNDLKDLKQNNKKLESRCDDLVDKYSKLLLATTTLQVKFANFTAENQGGKLHFVQMSYSL
ncbi:uncharacterized protein LOC106165060 [Lingula anatina]|uniref:Uncharacterized protein LOC106165060 n=1 Tax=Lingula anatina TaxID=7574 RepID=A0A1S3IKJ0_LINAN|nr:uncharacterized protein LOC106165060 [Lingula anatina]|eukprot:XP_013398608.1 uncharacterized protein LOC106165060 [Lingula anatina]